jgi:HSP20 family protein
MRPKNLIITAVSVMTIGAFVMTPLAFADEESQDLKQQVKELQQKVSELEGALQSKGSTTSFSHQPTRRRWDPFFEMNRIQDEMNDMFHESFFRGAGQNDFGGLVSPDADIHETDNQYVVKLDIPGMEKTNIDIETKGDQLVISGEKQSSAESDDQANHYYKKERSIGYFSRAILLPEDADKNNINAEYNNGVLTVKIAKSETSKALTNKKIKVN